MENYKKKKKTLETIYAREVTCFLNFISFSVNLPLNRTPSFQQAAVKGAGWCSEKPIHFHGT